MSYSVLRPAPPDCTMQLYTSTSSVLYWPYTSVYLAIVQYYRKWLNKWRIFWLVRTTAAVFYCPSASCIELVRTTGMLNTYRQNLGRGAYGKVLIHHVTSHVYTSKHWSSWTHCRLLAIICNKWKRKVTYPNPLLPVAITVPGICACQCTSLTESI